MAGEEHMCALHGVLVTYRRGEQLREYLDVLAGQTRALDSLVVVDNDVDASARHIVDTHGLPETEVHYLMSGDNIGPAGGIALGMCHVLDRATDDDWLLTLDDDDPPRTPDMIGELARFAVVLRDTDPTVGGVGLCGGCFDGRRGRFVTVADSELDGPVRSSWIGGNQLPCYSVRAVRAVGVFDKRYFINFEELDYGLRMADHGYRIYAHGRLWRLERERAGRLNRKVAPDRRLADPSWRRYYSLRNLVFLLRQRRRPLVALRVAAESFAKPLVNLPRSPDLAWQHLRLNFRAVTDAYRGRMGRTVPPVAKTYGSRP